MVPSNPIEKNTPSRPLHDAVNLGSITIVMKLLAKNTSILDIDADGNSPLHLAFINKNIVIIDLILKKIQQTSNYVNLKNKGGLSYLHIACTRRMGKTIESFLNTGANAEDAVAKESTLWAGFTACHFAIAFRSLDSLKVLLNYDINRKVKNNADETPLALAYHCVEDWLIMIDLLESSNLEDEPCKSLSNFHMACLTKDDKMVKNFIDHGVEVNSRTAWRTSVEPYSTSLHCAAVSRDLKKVQLLLENGAKLDFKNSDNMTPLHLAFYNENPLYGDKENTVEIVDLLYKSIEDKSIECVDKYGLSYFHISITRNDLSTVKNYLDNRTIDMNKSISQGAPRFSKYTPLQLAVRYQYPDIVELLLKYGADVNATNKKKPETPLYMAFEAGDTDFIELFLKNGANVNEIVNENKKTMLHQVTGHCCFVFPSRRGDRLPENEKAILMYIEQLIKLGIDVNAKDANGDTAMHLICLELEININYFQLLLELGADINLENNRGNLPFNLNNEKMKTPAIISKACAIFYHHVQKLKALDIKIHPKNEEYCKMILKKKLITNEELMTKGRQRLSEISKMKKVNIGATATVYEFLNFDTRRASLYARNKTLEKIIEDEDLKKKYPCYAYLIQLQYHKAVDHLQGQQDVAEKKLSLKSGKINFSKRKRYVWYNSLFLYV